MYSKMQNALAYSCGVHVPKGQNCQTGTLPLMLTLWSPNKFISALKVVLLANKLTTPSEVFKFSTSDMVSKNAKILEHGVVDLEKFNRFFAR